MWFFSFQQVETIDSGRAGNPLPSSAQQSVGTPSQQRITLGKKFCPINILRNVYKLWVLRDFFSRVFQEVLKLHNNPLWFWKIHVFLNKNKRMLTLRKPSIPTRSQRPPKVDHHEREQFCWLVLCGSGEQQCGGRQRRRRWRSQWNDAAAGECHHAGRIRVTHSPGSVWTGENYFI